MKPFWLVWCDGPGRGCPTVKHDSQRSAEQEAERLARRNRNQRFVILQAQSTVSVSDVYWTRVSGTDLDDACPS